MNLVQIKILKTIHNICKDEGFKIIDTADLLSEIIELNAEMLQDEINTLRDLQYIELKYSDIDEYCLNITNNGRAKLEGIARTQAKQKEQLNEQKAQTSKQPNDAKKVEKQKVKTKKTPNKREEVTEVASYTTEVACDSSQEGVDQSDISSATIVIKEIMLNRATFISIAKIAFFSGFLGAVLGSIIVAVIFMFI